MRKINPYESQKLRAGEAAMRPEKRPRSEQYGQERPPRDAGPSARPRDPRAALGVTTLFKLGAPVCKCVAVASAPVVELPAEISMTEATHVSAALPALRGASPLWLAQLAPWPFAPAEQAAEFRSVRVDTRNAGLVGRAQLGCGARLLVIPAELFGCAVEACTELFGQSVVAALNPKLLDTFVVVAFRPPPLSNVVTEPLSPMESAVILALERALKPPSAFVANFLEALGVRHALPLVAAELAHAADGALSVRAALEAAAARTSPSMDNALVIALLAAAGCRK